MGRVAAWRTGLVWLVIGLLAASPGVALGQPPDWPQAHGDLPADPAVRFGVLANGMRYAILRNQTPKNEVSVRFRIAVGSLNESDNEQGVAHLLEHMSFRGSRHVPAAEVWKGFQRLGMAVGADTSAYTQDDQTFYQFDLPNADPKTIDFGLIRLRETASELNLDPTMLETERGAVLSEERLRDTPDLRAIRAQRDFLFQGLLLPNRTPIGKIDVIQHADAELLRAFYRAYYRPDRATLIVVGDVDPDQIEARIKARFADWRASGRSRPEPDLGAPTNRGLSVRLVVDPKVSRSILVGWVSPSTGGLRTKAEARRLAMEGLAFSIVNRRFRAMAHGAAPPFIEASIAAHNQGQSAHLTLLGVDDTPLRWREALRAAEIARRQAVTYGVRQDEVDQEISIFRARMEADAAGAATRQTPGLARGLLSAVDDDRVFTTPAENLAEFEANMKGLTAAEVTNALRAAFQGSGPLVFISSPGAIEGGETAVTAAFAAIEAEPIAAPPDMAKIDWPYAQFGSPGALVERREIADLGVTAARFANGVRLNVKPTKFSTEQVQVSVAIGHGLLDLPKDRATVRWAADAGAFLFGGLGKIGLEDLQRALASKIYGLGFGTKEDHFELTGATRPADLATQLQLLAAYASDPGFRPEAFDRVRSLARPMINEQEASPTGVMQRQLPFLMHDGDPRWAPPTRIELSMARPADLRAALARPLAEGPIEVTIVGDVDVQAAIDAAAATFGALPPRPSDEAPTGARAVAFPKPQQEPVLRHHRGRSDQALFLIAWPCADMLGDMQTPRDLRILEQVLKSRLFDQFRIADGAAYEADTALENSQIFPGYGYIDAFAEAPPDKADLFYATVARIVADLRTHRISPDELERARQPRVELFTKARQTNQYWITVLSGSQADPRRLEIARTTIPGLQHVTADDVLRAAKAYLVDDRAWRLRIDPTVDGAPPANLVNGVAELDCAATEPSRLTDCRVVRETPPGIGVGAEALALAPNLKVDSKSLPPPRDGRVQIDFKVPAPASGE